MKKLKIVLLVLVSVVSFYWLFYLYNKDFIDFKDSFFDSIIINQYTQEKNEFKIDSLEIIEETNKKRIEKGLLPLTENGKLNQVAEVRIFDMFEKQYFAHVSPVNEDVKDTARLINYSFIGIGENLAKGFFKNSLDVVNGWMDSPGHRKNILHSGYTEIGVSAKKGFINNEETWIAVQVFGLPESACTKPSEGLLNEINEKEQLINEKIFIIESLKKEIDQSSSNNKEKINEYNNIVFRYNDLIEEKKY